MTTYNTGNPVPSADARDRYDNSQTLDEVVNGDSESYATRTGKQVISLGGMNSRFNSAQDERESEYSSDKISRDTEFSADQAERDVQFQNFLQNSGYEDVGDYAAGIEITARNQVFAKDGELYRVKTNVPLPYTLTGVWADESFRFVSVGDAALRQELAASTGASKVGFTRRSIADMVDGTIEAYIAATCRSLWELRNLVVSRPVLIDPDTWDWHPAIQAAADLGGPWFCPNTGSAQAIYLISKVVEIRYNRRFSIFGQFGNRSFSRIATTTTFTDRSMFRQWAQDWYAAGETDQNERPANLTAYSSRVDRYFNCRYLEFYIQSDLGGEVTCLDFVALQETSFLGGIIFNGLSTVEKGFPIRIRTGGGSEISMNGSKIQDVVTYGGKWRGELVCKGSGSDLDVDNWVTSNAAHKESAFQTSLIDVTMRNIHSEAHTPGISTFKSEGGGLSVSQSLVVVRDLQGDIFETSGPITLSQIVLYPVGGNSSNVTNKVTINVVRDFMVSNTRLLPWQMTNMGVIARVVSYSRDSANVSDSAGTTLTISPTQANLPLPVGVVCNAANALIIPYRLRGTTDPIHSAEVTIVGRRISTGRAVTLKVRVTQSNNFAGAAPRDFKIIENDGWPTDVAIVLSGEYFTVTTADATGIANIKATCYGSIFFNAVNQ